MLNFGKIKISKIFNLWSKFWFFKEKFRINFKNIFYKIVVSFVYGNGDPKDVDNVPVYTTDS